MNKFKLIVLVYLEAVPPTGASQLNQNSCEY